VRNTNCAVDMVCSNVVVVVVVVVEVVVVVVVVVVVYSHIALHP
jgi:hypothetical protein